MRFFDIVALSCWSNSLLKVLCSAATIPKKVLELNTCLISSLWWFSLLQLHSCSTAAALQLKWRKYGNMKKKSFWHGKKLSWSSFFLNWLTSQGLLEWIQLHNQKVWVPQGSGGKKWPWNDQNSKNWKNNEKKWQKLRNNDQVSRKIAEYASIVHF